MKSALQKVSRYSSSASQPLIKKALEGVDFKVIATDKRPEVIQAMDTFTKVFFKDVINQSPDKANEGGEQVLTTMPPTKELPTSHHLMHFEGDQDWHYHAGQRDLNIFGSKPFSLFAGGMLDEPPKDGKLNFVEVQFPAGTMLQLRFPGKYLHGFKGDNFSAISIHHTDLDELQELAQKTGRSVDANSKELMPELTTFLDKDNLNLLASIDFKEVEKLNKQPNLRVL